MTEKDSFALKLVIYSLLAVVTVYLIVQLKVLIICVLLAIMLAAAISPVAEFGEKKRIPRAATVFCVYACLVFFYLLLGWLVAPAVVEQGRNLVTAMPKYFSQSIASIESFGNLIHQVGAKANQDLTLPTISSDDIHALTQSSFKQTLTMTAGVMGLLVNLVLILFLAGYFVINAKSIWSGLLSWVPKLQEPRLASLIVPLEKRVGGYIRGQMLVAFMVAIFLFLGLSLIQLPYALVLSIIAGALNFVPYIGSLISSIFCVIVAVNQSPLTTVLVILLFVVEQWMESSFFVPYLVGKQVDLDPLVVMLGMIAGATLLGLPGAMLSVPLLAAAKFIAEEFYRKPAEEADQTFSDASQTPPA